MGKRTPPANHHRNRPTHFLWFIGQQNHFQNRYGAGQALRGTEGGERNRKSFLAPLSIRKIPMVGDKTYMQLRNMGISKCRTLQEMEVFTMQRVLGENGITIWKKANGLDDTPLIPFHEQKSMSKETTYLNDTIDMDLLKKTLAGMVNELGFDLRKDQKLTGCITLKIRYSNFDTHTKQLRIPYTNSDRIIHEKINELFGKLYSRRMLIRLVGIKFSHLVTGNYQTDLFNDNEKDLKLAFAMDRIRLRHGFKAVARGNLFLE